MRKNAAHVKNFCLPYDVSCFKIDMQLTPLWQIRKAKSVITNVIFLQVLIPSEKLRI